MHNDLVKGYDPLKGMKKVRSKEGLSNISTTNIQRPKNDKPVTMITQKLSGATLETEYVKGHAILPQTYLNYLSNTKLEGIFANSLVLAIDFRPRKDFELAHVSSSLNMCLTPIIVRRLKQKILTKFDLTNFLTSATCKTNFKQIQEEFEKKKVDGVKQKVLVIVFDQVMANTESDSWTLIEILQSGLCGNFMDALSESEISFDLEVGYLHGGFNSFSVLDNVEPFINSIASSTRSSGNTSSKFTISDSGLDKSMKRPSFSITTDLTPRSKKKLSISVGSSQSDSTSSSTLKSEGTSISSSFPDSKKNTGSNQLSNLVPLDESPLNSPTTPPMSAIVHPYTLIMPYLYIGSDSLPCSPTANQELNDLKVTHVLNVAADVITSPTLPLEFEVKWLKIKDNLEEEIYEDLKHACEFIGKY